MQRGFLEGWEGWAGEVERENGGAGREGQTLSRIWNDEETMRFMSLSERLRVYEGGSGTGRAEFMMPRKRQWGQGVEGQRRVALKPHWHSIFGPTKPSCQEHLAPACSLSIFGPGKCSEPRIACRSDILSSPAHDTWCLDPASVAAERQSMARQGGGQCSPGQTQLAREWAISDACAL